MLHMSLVRVIGSEFFDLLDAVAHVVIVVTVGALV